MKAITLLLALMCAPAMAAEDDASCEQLSRLGEAIMSARQAGLPLSRLMDIEELSTYRDVIIGVYRESPIERTQESKQFAIDQFRDQVAVECYSNGGK